MSLLGVIRINLCVVSEQKMNAQTKPGVTVKARIAENVLNFGFV